MNKLKLIRDLLGRGYQSGEEYLFTCPFCDHHKKKLSVNIERNKWKCWICDKAGRNIFSLVRRVGDRAQVDAWKKLANITDFSAIKDELDTLFEEKEEIRDKVNLPEEFISLANTDPPISSLVAKGYLKKRGITKSDILKWKIGYCSTGDFAGRIIIPSFDLDGNINYFIARSYNGSWRKFMNPTVSRTKVVFNELVVDFESPVTLVEGVFDAIVAGENSIPLLGSTLREDSRLFKKIVENNSIVYMALDPDASKKTDSIVKKLLHYGVKVFIIDVTGYDDVGEMSKGQFNKRRNEASPTDSLSLLYNRVLGE